MARKMILTVTAIVLGICLLSGGCNSGGGSNRVQDLKDLIKASLTNPAAEPATTSLEDLLATEPLLNTEQVEVTLYYGDQDKQGLVAEKRSMEKTTGIARATIQELLKGPAQPGHNRLFPEGTKLLDINIRPDGLCIVDLSNHIRNVPTGVEANLMVYSLVNTLGEYPSIQEVSLIIDGDYADILNYVDLSNPLEPDYYLVK